MLMVACLAVHSVCEDHGAFGAERGRPAPEEGGHRQPRQLLPRAHPRAEGQSTKGPVQL